MFRQRLPRRILYTYTIHSRIPLSKKKREIPSESVHVIRSSSHQDSNPACFRTWKPKMEVVPAQFCKDSSQNSLSWRISTICLYTSCVGSVVLRFCHTLVYMKGIERNVEIADFSVIVYFSALVQTSLIHSGNCQLNRKRSPRRNDSNRYVSYLFIKIPQTPPGCHMTELEKLLLR